VKRPGDVHVAGVLLAAGASSRFGSPKLLADVGGEPLLRKVTRTFCDAGFDEVLVVVGCGGDALRESVTAESGAPRVRLVDNPRWNAGMFTSVKTGLAAVVAGGRSTHVAVSPADLPFLCEESLRRMKDAAALLDERTLAVPAHAGRRGHPLVFSAALVPRILSWPDDRRLSDLFSEPDLRIHHVEGFDDGILRDVDRPQDLR
jgi:molybdenum cofactor cytidylyltransferase